MRRSTTEVLRRAGRYCAGMTDVLDIDAMLTRFKDRAASVKKRNLPPVGGDERKAFLDQAQLDFQDYAMIGDAEATLVDGVLTLTIDLRPATD
jgi:hypothetical protein